MTDPAKLDAFLVLVRAGGAIVCAPELAEACRSWLPEDIRERATIIAHPWCPPGEVVALGVGATLLAPLAR